MGARGRLRRGLDGGLIYTIGPVVITANNQVVEGLDIYSQTEAVVNDGYSGVIVRGNRMTHTLGRGPSGNLSGVKATNAANMLIEDNEIINGGAPLIGMGSQAGHFNISLTGCSSPIVRRNTLRRGSTLIYFNTCSDTTAEENEGHDPRGPFPRGGVTQYVSCTGTHYHTHNTLETIPGVSAVEDCFSIYFTPNVHISQYRCDWGGNGYAGRSGVAGAGPNYSGRMIVFEGSGTTGCTIDDAEFNWYHNGAFCAADAPGVEFTNMKVRGWLPYGLNGYAGSSNAGANSGLVGAFLGTSIAAVVSGFSYHDIPTDNLSYDGANVVGGNANPALVDWTSTIDLVRNEHPWRRMDVAPVLVTPPWIGSYHLDGTAGTSPTTGNVLTCVPGRWEHDPKTWAFQWYRNGVAITGSTKNYHTIVSGDLGAKLACLVTPANAAGSASALTAALPIAA